MVEKQFLEGLRSHESLATVLDTGPGNEGAQRLGRLIGVTLPEPSHYSHACRGWERSRAGSRVTCAGQPEE